jgi:3'(2'), 5'-bisphosphate nucleotidase
MNTLFKKYQDIIKIAQKAGDLAFEKRKGLVEVTKKDDGSKVTQIDIELNTLILDGINKLYPNDIAVGEETFNYESVDSTRRVWYVDPIDGTDEFINNGDEWAVHIGLSDNKKAIFGIVYQAPLKKLYFGSTEESYLLDLENGQLTKLSCSGKVDISEMKIVDSKFRSNKLALEVLKNLNAKEVINCSSMGVKLCRIADGNYDFYLNSGQCSVWDTCAPEAIIKGAGGVIKRYKNNNFEDMSYIPEIDKTAKIGNPFIVCNPNFEKEITELLNDKFKK